MCRWGWQIFSHSYQPQGICSMLSEARGLQQALPFPHAKINDNIAAGLRQFCKLCSRKGAFWTSDYLFIIVSSRDVDCMTLRQKQRGFLKSLILPHSENSLCKIFSPCPCAPARNFRGISLIFCVIIFISHFKNTFGQIVSFLHRVDCILPTQDSPGKGRRNTKLFQSFTE